MKTRLKNRFLMVVLLVGIGSVVIAQGQTFTVLHSLAATTGVNSNNIPTNTDGVSPAAGLTLSGTTLYGTAYFGGNWGNGTVFKLNMDGTGFQVLHNFTATSTNSAGIDTNSDGCYPHAGLVLYSNRLYGTAIVGGPSGLGTIFALDADGSNFQVIHSFIQMTNFQIVLDGAVPDGGLILAGRKLYGTTYGGGGFANSGTVFAVNPDGTGFMVLDIFDPYRGFPVEGGNPYSGLTSSGTALYGTTEHGPVVLGNPPTYGTVFVTDLNGGGMGLLHQFKYQEGSGLDSGLVLLGTNLYGTASGGGSSGNGTIFRLDITGGNLTILHSFTAAGGTNASGYILNTDGAYPEGSLLLSGNTLYGTAVGGGSFGHGTVFALSTDGTGFRVLHSFSEASISPLGFLTNSDGGAPSGSLILSDDTLYGTTGNGGVYGSGTIFSLSLPATKPQLAIEATGTNFLLTWPTNFAGLILQSTTNLGSPVWTTNLPAPVVINGQYTVTNPISGTQQFFRLPVSSL